MRRNIPRLAPVFDIPEVELYYTFSAGSLDVFSPEMRYFALILVGRMSVFGNVFF